MLILPMRMILLMLLRRLPLQILHMLVMIVHLLLIRREVGFRLRRQPFVPVAFALALFSQLVLFQLLDFFRGAVGVFFEGEAEGGGEGSESGWAREGTGGGGAEEGAHGWMCWWVWMWKWVIGCCWLIVSWLASR